MKEELKILMLEDVGADAELIQRELVKGKIQFSAKIVKCKNDFIECLDKYHPDIILADHTLPQFSSNEAFQIYQDRKLKIPFILVTGTVSEEFAVECLHCGFDDYILKANLARLPSAINNALKKREIAKEKEDALLDIKDKNLELARLNEELDRFVYGASHDLRAPVTSILGLLSILKKEKNEAMRKQYLDLLEVSALKLDTTIRDIITYSKNSREIVQISKIDIKELVSEVLASQKQFPDVKDYDVVKDIDASVPFFSDRKRLYIILNCLLQNALTFAGEQRLAIKIKGTVTPIALELSLEDNGIGMEENKKDVIFEMFYRGSEKSKGAGMGLYIVKELLRKLNGQIIVSSKPGVGSVFSITVPNMDQNRV